MNASLNEKLRAVKWGEFKLGDLFDIKTTKSVDKNKINFSDNGKYDFIGRSKENNGVQGKVEILSYSPNPKNTFSVSQVGETVCLFRKNAWYASQNIFILIPKSDKIVAHHLFFVSAINKALVIYSDAYTYPILSELKNIIVKLSVLSDGSIDFDFMESFIAELEAERVAELSAYLTVSGLDNYELSSEEEKAIEDYKTYYGKQWGEYRIGALFERVSTKKLPYKANDLPKQPLNDYVLPCLTSSFQNQGLNYYVPKEGATILSNVISIPSNSDVYRAYYQSREFTVLSDAYAIQWTKKIPELSSKQYLFLVMCINKITDLPIYSYKNKLGGWNVVKDIYINLPEKNGEIDYEYMDLLISAIQKLVIKDVVIYADRKIEKTKEVVH